MSFQYMTATAAAAAGCMLGQYGSSSKDSRIVVVVAVTQMLEANYQTQHAQYAGMYTDFSISVYWLVQF
jgi:hypothetical protein